MNKDAEEYPKARKRAIEIATLVSVFRKELIALGTPIELVFTLTVEYHRKLLNRVDLA